MSMNKILNEHQRLSILHCLAAMDDYRANNSIIQMVCEQYGNAMTSDKIATHLHWLKEQEFIELEAHESYTVAKITKRGLDVERGIAKTPGIKRPGPR